MVEPTRILAVKLADLGDLLLAEPALRSLHAAYPEARIDLLTTPRASELATIMAPWVNVLAFQRDELLLGRISAMVAVARLAAQVTTASYDMTVLFHHLTTSRGATRQRLLARLSRAPRVVGLDNGRGGFLTDRVIDPGFGVKHEAELFVAIAAAAGGANLDPRPKLEPRPAPISIDVDYAIIAPTTGRFSKAREWPRERFVAVAHELERRHGLRSVIVGTADTQPLTEQIVAGVPAAVDLTGRTSIADLIGLVSHASLVVSNDSFPAHLSAALDRPSVTIFGPSNVSSWSPVSSVLDTYWDMSPGKQVVISASLPCSPCLYTGYRLGRPSGCPTRTCLQIIDVERVMRAIERVLGDHV